MSALKVHLRFEGQTDVWTTDEVLQAILDHDERDPEVDISDPKQGMIGKLRYWSKAGFRNHEGTRGQPIKYEWEGAYRLGLYGDLFRVYGFYTDEIRKTCFYVVRSHADKKGKKNTARERRIINEVVEIRRQWLEEQKQNR